MDSPTTSSAASNGWDVLVVRLPAGVQSPDELAGGAAATGPALAPLGDVPTLLSRLEAVGLRRIDTGDPAMIEAFGPGCSFVIQFTSSDPFAATDPGHGAALNTLVPLDGHEHSAMAAMLTIRGAPAVREDVLSALMEAWGATALDPEAGTVLAFEATDPSHEE